MKYQVIDANIAFQSDELIETLRELTLHPGSGMHCELDTMMDALDAGKEIDAFFIFARVEKRIVGWALLTSEDSTSYFVESGRLVRFNKSMGSMFQVFVLPHYRREGIGKHLLYLAKSIAFGEVIVVPWDKASKAFYKNDMETKAIKSLDVACP